MSDRFVDPVVAEIHANRAAMLQAAGGDIVELMRQVAERQERSGRRVIRAPRGDRMGLASEAERQPPDPTKAE